jgi:hypothetical protein
MFEINRSLPLSVQSVGLLVAMTNGEFPRDETNPNDE